MYSKMSKLALTFGKIDARTVEFGISIEFSHPQATAEPFVQEAGKRPAVLGVLWKMPARSALPLPPANAGATIG
jgi:hypothetical protein